MLIDCCYERNIGNDTSTNGVDLEILNLLKISLTKNTKLSGCILVLRDILGYQSPGLHGQNSDNFNNNFNSFNKENFESEIKLINPNIKYLQCMDSFRFMD